MALDAGAPRTAYRSNSYSGSQTFTTTPNVPTALEVLQADSIASGEPVTLASASAVSPSGPTLVQNADGSLAFASANTGTYTFTQTITSPVEPGKQTQATITVNVVAQNVTANNDSYTIAANTPTNLNVLGNDTDPQGTSLQVISSTPVAPPGPSLTQNADGTFTFSGSAGSSGGATAVASLDTGVDTTNNLLAPYTVDAKYQVTGPDSGTYFAQARDVSGLPSEYIPATTNSRWDYVVTSATSTASEFVTVGNYDFTTTVDLTGFNPATADITGLQVAADNEFLAVTINGQTVFSRSENGFVIEDFHSILSVGDLGLGAFHSGLNTIQFTVFNQGFGGGNSTSASPAAFLAVGEVEASPMGSGTGPYTFNYTASAAQQEVTASDGAANDGLGSAVAISGNTAVVGAPITPSGAIKTRERLMYSRSSGRPGSSNKNLSPQTVPPATISAAALRSAATPSSSVPPKATTQVDSEPHMCTPMRGRSGLSNKN